MTTDDTYFGVERLHRLYDAQTDEDLGEATPPQVEASDKAAEYDNGAGIFVVDAAGIYVVGARIPMPKFGERKVYTSVPFRTKAPLQ